MAKTYNFRGTVPWFICNTLTNFTGKSKINFLQPQVSKLNFFKITESFFSWFSFTNSGLFFLPIPSAWPRAVISPHRFPSRTGLLATLCQATSILCPAVCQTGTQDLGKKRQQPKMAKRLKRLPASPILLQHITSLQQSILLYCVIEKCIIFPGVIFSHLKIPFRQSWTFM